MGYQALLFCPDEKLARVVAQVFGDLEFSVEPVQEPFSAVKRLMAQRYDALVVDCQNDSNASLLFKSARNSTTNQGTLAIALVEGQAGVAKAYRIGANLVLTKPINVEQAKGTLRVARGLLRKSAEGAAPASTSASVASPVMPAAPAVTSSSVIAQSTPIAASPSPARELAEFEPAAPAAPDPPKIVEPAVAASPVQEISAGAETAQVPVAMPTLEAQEPATTPAPVAISNPNRMLVTSQGAAAAPAKSKEVAPADSKLPEFEPVDSTKDSADFQASEVVGSSPSFSALELDGPAKSGGSRKILVAAVVLVAAAALGYFGWTKLASRAPISAPAKPVTAPHAAPALPPAAPAAVAPSTGTTSPAPAETQSAKVSPVIASTEPEGGTKSAVPRIDINPPAETKAPTVTPIVVKSKPSTQSKKTEDIAEPMPNPLAVGEANTEALSSVVASSGATPHRPTLNALKISQGVSQGLLIKRVDPKYPQSALAMHVQGAVLLDATIDREGQISNLKVVKGDQVLARAATDAVRQWRYKPYYLDGEPVEIQTQITINFKLPN